MSEKTIRSLAEIPIGQHNVSRYDTQDERVLSVWSGGSTWDIREPKTGGLAERCEPMIEKPVKL